MSEELLFDIRYYAKRVVGPVALSFVSWIIDSAEKRGLKRLYFLARDGYILFKIAKRICESKGLSIECRYLYCSRTALRTPTYHLIGDEAYELLTLGGYYLTPKTILMRASLSDEEIDEICESLSIPDINKPLSSGELDSLRNSLTASKKYKNAVAEGSRLAYDPTISYLKNEGLFERDKVAIVDSGWTGSMQRSLRQLARSAGYEGEFIGFYFGMYTEPREACDGEYLCYYFDAHRGVRRKIFFNNNLFECMLSADHPMTIGYTASLTGCFPRFAEEKSEREKALIREQLAGAMDFVNERLREGYAFKLKAELKRCYKILKRAMAFPTRRFATVYGSFLFCDDVTEGYHLPLADEKSRKSLYDYMLIPRIVRKIFGLKKRKTRELLWPYGVVAFAPLLLRPWYRLNLIGWELLKALLSRKRGKKPQDGAV